MRFLLSFIFNNLSLRFQNEGLSEIYETEPKTPICGEEEEIEIEIRARKEGNRDILSPVETRRVLPQSPPPLYLRKSLSTPQLHLSSVVGTGYEETKERDSERARVRKGKYRSRYRRPLGVAYLF